MQPGWIYVLECPQLAAFKIGKTTNLRKRVKTLRIQLPFPVSVRGVIPTPDINWLESEIHSDLAAKRLNGEWFSLNNNDLGYLQSIAAIGFASCPDEMYASHSAFWKQEGYAAT